MPVCPAPVMHYKRLHETGLDVILFFLFLAIEVGRLPPLPKWKGVVLYVVRETFYEGTEGVLVEELAGGAAVGLVGLVNAMHLAIGMVVLQIPG